MERKTERKILLYIDTLENYSREQLQNINRFLGAGRRAKIDRLPEGNGKDLSVLSSMLLERALLETGIPAPDSFESAESGKPVLPGHPEISFSISHSGRYAAAAVIRSNPGEDPVSVGVDVEDPFSRKKEILDLLKIAERFFSKEDYDFLRELSSEERWIQVFYQMWTFYEARMKSEERPLLEVMGRESLVREKRMAADGEVLESSAGPLIFSQGDAILSLASYQKKENGGGFFLPIAPDQVILHGRFTVLN